MLLTHTSGIIDGAGYNRAISRGIFTSLDVVMQSNNFSGKMCIRDRYHTAQDDPMEDILASAQQLGVDISIEN